MLYNKLAREIKILVEVNHKEVSEPIPEFFAFTLFGVT
jgi:hypothetical protein